MKKKERKIVLLGTAPSSMNLTPFASPDWEIWACSPGTYPNGVDSIDIFFELHRFEPGQPWFGEGYVEFLQTFPRTVWMTKLVDSIPNSKLLPYEALVAKYGPYFFTSSLAWMCAMAIEAGATTIAFYGVDMAATTEYHDQRMGCQYMACVAAAMGIEVGVPPESDLLRPAPLYGVCENSHAWIKATVRAKELAANINEADAIIAEQTQRKVFFTGAVDDQDWHLHSFIGAVDSQGSEFTSPPIIPVLKR